MIVTQENEHDRRKHYSACRMLMKLVKAQANHCCQAATQHSCTHVYVFCMEYLGPVILEISRKLPKIQIWG